MYKYKSETMHLFVVVALALLCLKLVLHTILYYICIYFLLLSVLTLGLYSHH